MHTIAEIPARPLVPAACALLVFLAACAMEDGRSSTPGAEGPGIPFEAAVASDTSATNESPEALVASSREGCPCELRIDPVVTLRDDEGVAGLSEPGAVMRLPDGSFLVVPMQRRDALLRFSSEGSFSGRVGRAGAGPEEFRNILGLQPGRADTTLVMDAGNGRMAFLDRELRTARSASMPVLAGWYGTLPGGELLVMRGIPSRASEPIDRLLVLTPELEPIRSFMPVQPEMDGQNAFDLRRRIAVSRSGTIAVVHWNRYVVEIWDPTGQHSRTHEPASDWFIAPSPGSSSGTTSVPAPRLESPRFDAEGRLWIVGHVADPEWAEAAPEAPPARRAPMAAGAPTGARPPGQEDLLDTVVEVLHPSTGVRLATLRVDPYLELISDDGYAASYQEDDTGNPRIQIWRLALRSRN